MASYCSLLDWITATARVRPVTETTALFLQQLEAQQCDKTSKCHLKVFYNVQEEIEEGMGSTEGFNLLK